MINKAAISRGLCLAALAGSFAQAQTVAAGARAAVNSDTLPVYTSTSDTSTPKLILKRGDVVIIGLVLFGSETTWCAISKVGETKRLGFASCEFLEPDRPTAQSPAPVERTAPAPVPAPPPPVAEPKAQPVAVREAPPIPTPVPVPAPAPVVPALKPVAPEPPPAAKPDLVEAVLNAGLRAAVTNYTKTTRLISFLDKGRLVEIDVETLERVIGEQFQPGAFYAAIGVQLRKDDSPESLPALLDWFRSPVAKKLADLERRAATAESRQKLVEFAGSLSKTPPPESRLLLVHRIYDAARTCDMEVEATIALVHSTAQAINPALPKEKRYSANDLDRALGGVKSRYRSVMKNARLVQYLFAYRAASDAELEQYAGFLESDGGKWLVSRIDKGFYDATASISRRLLAEIPRRVKPRQP